MTFPSIIVKYLEFTPDRYFTMYDVFSDPIGHELHVQSHLIYADFIEEAGKEFTAKCIRTCEVGRTSLEYYDYSLPNFMKHKYVVCLYIPNHILKTEIYYEIPYTEQNLDQIISSLLNENIKKFEH